MKLIKIGAAWCAPCNAMDKLLENFDLCEVVHYDIDNADDETMAMIDKYKVKSIPVMVLLDDNDNELKRWLGSTSLVNIEEEVKKHLQ